MIMKEPFKRYKLTVRYPYKHDTNIVVGYWSPRSGWRYDNHNKIRGRILKIEKLNKED